MASLAIRNLFHDKVRLAVTLTGIVFSVVLVAVQTGMFLGFTTTTSNVIDNSGADFWVTSKGVKYLEVAVPFSEKKLYHARAVEGVAEAEKYIVRFGQWKRPDGADESCELVGFDPDTRLGAPWRVAEGNVHDLKLPDSASMRRSWVSRTSGRPWRSKASGRGWSDSRRGFARSPPRRWSSHRTATRCGTRA
jgi:putative ABC transport system permease protein